MQELLVVCIDGTGNKPGQTDFIGEGEEFVVESNVFKFWRVLTGAPNVDDPVSLFGGSESKYYGVIGDVTFNSVGGQAIYFNGVGSQGGEKKENLDGAFGIGISRRIKDAYRFLAERYSGQKICLFGFSRGAFAVRSLAGFIAKVGLPHDKRIISDYELGRMYDCYKSGKKYSGGLSTALMPVAIDFLGLWDTVGSLAFENTHNNYHDLNPENVLAVRHALALDEVRPHFKPEFWDNKNVDSIVECWFCGAHSNVGGGYHKAELSNIPYIWMLREWIVQLKLKFELSDDPAYVAEALSTQVVHLRRDSFKEFYVGVKKAALWLRTFGHAEPRRHMAGQFFHPSVFDALMVESLEKYETLARSSNGEPITAEYLKNRMCYAVDWIPGEDSYLAP